MTAYAGSSGLRVVWCSTPRMSWCTTFESFWVRQNKLEWNSWDNRIVAMVYIEERRVDNGIGRKVSW